MQVAEVILGNKLPRTLPSGRTELQGMEETQCLSQVAVITTQAVIGMSGLISDQIHQIHQKF